MGLVIFLDLAYELLPPGTPSAELRPLVRYLWLAGQGKPVRERPVSPWSRLLGGNADLGDVELAQDILSETA